jgi:NitT/TauT family transport system substrate-binding protein
MRGLVTFLRSLVIGSLVLAPVLAGCTNTTASVTNGDVVNIGMTLYPGYAPLFIADAEGLFAKHGVNAHVVVANDLTQLLSAQSSNSLQISGVTADFAAVMANAGLDLKEFYTSDVGYGADGVLVTDDVKSVADLKGKTAYLALGTPSHFLLRTVAANAGLQHADVKLVKMEADQAGAAFAAGKIDVAVSWEPWLSKASAARAGSKVLFTSKDEAGIIADTFVVRSDFLKAHPEKVEGMVAAYLEAIELMKTNPEKTTSIAAKAFGITPAEFEEQIKTVRFLSADENMALFQKETPRNLYELTEQAVKIYKEDGIIEKDLDAESIVDPSVMQAYMNSAR